jgi:hypothetical protein
MLRVQDYVQRADEFKNKNVEVRRPCLLVQPCPQRVESACLLLTPLSARFFFLPPQVVFVGHGGKKKGVQYVETLKMEGRVPLYIDPKRKTHTALGLIDISTRPALCNQPLQQYSPLHSFMAGWSKLLTDSKGFQLSKEASKQGFKVALLGTGSHT